MKPLTVLKIGGSLLERKNFDSLVRGLASYLKKHQTLVVHGGGKEVSALAEEFGIKSTFVNGRRYTDARMMTIVEMALSGKVNPYLVGRLNALGVSALGLSGRDSNLVSARRISSLGCVGIPSKIRVDSIRRILALRDVPVFSSIASDGKGGALNVNADEMAGALARSLKASRLILFTDVPGILDPAKKTIPHINRKSAESLIREGVISGGMIPKVKSALSALEKGVQEVWILEGKAPLARAQGTLVSNQPLRRQPFS